MMTNQRNRWLAAMLLLAFWTMTYRHVAAQRGGGTGRHGGGTSAQRANRM